MPKMVSDFLLYDPGLKLLICEKHRLAIEPRNLPGHLKHHTSISSKQKSSIKSWVSAATKSGALVEVPPQMIPHPVPGIPVGQALKCPHCPFTAGTQDTLGKHYRKKHAAIGVVDRYHVEGDAQQLFGQGTPWTFIEGSTLPEHRRSRDL
jgi:hypothetical protein